MRCLAYFHALQQRCHLTSISIFYLCSLFIFFFHTVCSKKKLDQFHSSSFIEFPHFSFLINQLPTQHNQPSDQPTNSTSNICHPSHISFFSRPVSPFTLPLFPEPLYRLVQTVNRYAHSCFHCIRTRLVLPIIIIFWCSLFRSSIILILSSLFSLIHSLSLAFLSSSTFSKIFPVSVFLFVFISIPPRTYHIFSTYGFTLLPPFFTLLTNYAAFLFQIP